MVLFSHVQKIPKAIVTSSENPTQEKWEYFLDNKSFASDAISLISSVSDNKLRDITFLEKELIPALGLNNENLHEQPAELFSFFFAKDFIFSNIQIN